VFLFLRYLFRVGYDYDYYALLGHNGVLLEKEKLVFSLVRTSSKFDASKASHVF
jgi:hypothetical protein